MGLRRKHGYAVALKFSTEGAGANLSLNFTNSQGNAGGTSIYGPVYWQVEYSTDGVNFTVLPESGFCCRPFVYWQGAGGKDLSYCAVPATPTACSSCRTPCATARRSRC